MQAVHEFGHVLGAWMTGGHVTRVVLYPLSFSRTDFLHNPHPLIVVWSGPIAGVVIPFLLWGIAVAARMRFAFVLRLYAGFCLLANGLYIGAGAFNSTGDCGEMLRHGSPLWQLLTFGALAVPMGLWMWHRQGLYFGLGSAKRSVDRITTYGVLAVCLLLLMLEFVLGRQ